MKRMKCFTCAACSYNCPNAAIEAYDERYGYGLAADMGYKKIKCKDCMYNTGKCEDCLFYKSEDCAKVRNMQR